MMEFFKKHKFEIIGAVVILALVILFWASLGGHSTSAPRGTSGEQETVAPPAPPASAPTPSPQPPASSSTKPVSPLRITGKPLPGKTYQEVVESYKNRRMQFDASCRATPNFLTFKNGPEIMFDNRTASEKVIKLDGQGYKIGPYGFVVLSITSNTLPFAVEIDCNQLFNAAIINLQK